MRIRTLALLSGLWFVPASILGSCSGGSTGTQGAFALIEFLEAGKSDIPRNRALSFVFSSDVAPGQDFPQRLKIQNVLVSQGQSNFSRAIGIYLPSGNRIDFLPRLPESKDRADAGFRADAHYVVFLQAGPDALASMSGDRIDTQQEFGFDTNGFFEDLDPFDPPRALTLVAVDTNTDQEIDVSRVDPRPVELALVDNADLIAAGRVIEPGAGGPPAYSTPWEFRLALSEPLDPATVSTKYVEMYEIRSDATTSDENSAPSAPAGHFGTPVQFKVPIRVEMHQHGESNGTLDVEIRVTPLFTLVDDTRYRLTFSGNILGIDYRKSFIGDNGLTGDGQTVLAQATPYAEPGGLGYTTEFIVRDRPAIQSTRTVTYDPLVDGILPEKGQSTLDEDLFNSALYNPLTAPGTAVGFLSAFGDGRDGNLAVSGGNTVIVDTGDTPNPPIESPFSVQDINPDDDYLNDTRPGRLVTYDSPEYFELQLESLTVSSSSVLRVTGVNPILFRVSGVTQVAGTLDASGEDGANGGGAVASGGGQGAGGYPGGSARQGVSSCRYTSGSCTNFVSYLNSCSPAKSGFPFSLNGNGPGRGFAGGEAYNYDYADDRNNSATGTGGGGAGHALTGVDGEDRRNAGAAPGTSGSACSITARVRNSGVVGVRGKGGVDYGDREVIDVLIGGSGGAAGGSTSVWGPPKQQAGGGGGGGGGSIAIISSGPIIVAGGVIDASGGNGGKGFIKTGSSAQNWYSVSGGGGGGAGGNIALISGDSINLTGALLDAGGGAGGARANNLAGGCNGCNAGGDGGKGFIFLMDADGRMEGFLPEMPGEYDTFARGVLTISEFKADRFSSISAITELFNVLAADPDFLDLAPGDLLGIVNPGQRIKVLVSSAKGDPDEPLLPDPTTEIGQFEVAQLRHQAGAVTVDITGDLDDLNPAGQVPDRDAFVRVRATFEYDNGVEAALGPFASIDRVDLSFTFNG